MNLNGGGAPKNSLPVSFWDGFVLAEFAAYVSVYRYKRKIAFTMAEVLITLGIIGIIAAMTLPALITAYQGKSNAIKLKKSLSALEQAQLRSILDGNLLETQYLTAGGVYIREEHEKFANYFKPYFNVVIDCAVPENSNSLCYNKDFDKNAVIYQIDRKTKVTALPNNTFRGFVADDGTSYFFYAGVSQILIDINSPMNKPNALGYDVFAFKLNKQGKIVPFKDEDTLNECQTYGLSCAKWALLYGDESYTKH